MSAAQLPPFGYAVGFDGTVPGLAVQPHPPLGPYVNYVGPAYLATVGTPLLRGREFTETDRIGSPPVAVVNQAMANVYWPGANPIGKCIIIDERSPNQTCATVIGVAATGKYMSVQEQPIPFVYLPLAQLPEATGRTVVVRVSGDPEAIVTEVRRAVAGLASDLPFVDVQPMSDALRPEILPYQLSAELFSALAAMSLGLAAVGLYGLTSYMVAQRQHEVGIRIALGARSGQVVMLMLRRGLRPLVFGSIIGALGGLITTRLLVSQLYHVQPGDPAAFAGAIVLLGAVSVLAAIFRRDAPHESIQRSRFVHSRRVQTRSP